MPQFPRRFFWIGRPNWGDVGIGRLPHASGMQQHSTSHATCGSAMRSVWFARMPITPPRLSFSNRILLTTRHFIRAWDIAKS